MKRIKLFEEHSIKDNPRFTKEEIEYAINSSDFDQFFSVDLQKVEIQSWIKSFESDASSTDPEYVKSEFSFYINEYGIECDTQGFQEELKKSLLMIKQEEPDDDDLLKDMGDMGFSEKYYTLQKVMSGIDKALVVIDQTDPKERDYILESMIDDPKSNPVQVWTRVKDYVGKIKFDKGTFADYLIDWVKG
jgi:hypothetical protein